MSNKRIMTSSTIAALTVALSAVSIAIWSWQKRRRRSKTTSDDEDEETGLIRRRRSSKLASTIAKFEKGPLANAEIRKCKKSKIPSKRILPVVIRPRCSVCQDKIFPTDPKTTARQREYHSSCFRCSTCGSKLQNLPEESHTQMGPTCFLHCKRCSVDSNAKYKPRSVARVAGSKIQVEACEAGKVEDVQEAIGDELEEAIYAMIPRCATCGQDFLNYSGEVSMVGVSKYHKDCFVMGRPTNNDTQPSRTLTPIQAAKYLPDTIILRLSSYSPIPTNKAQWKTTMASLYFCWNDKKQQLKCLQRTKANLDRVTLSFRLDPESGSRRSKQKFMVSGKLVVEAIGDIPATPVEVALVADSLPLSATLQFQKFNLNHSLSFNIPYCTSESSIQELELAHATLSVEIKNMDSVKAQVNHT